MEDGLLVNKVKYNKKSRQSTCSIETRQDEKEREREKKKRTFCVITQKGSSVNGRLISIQYTFNKLKSLSSTLKTFKLV